MQITHTPFLALVTALACLCAACGQKTPGVGGSAAPGSASQPRKGNATAQEVAEEMRGDVSCPARIKTPSRDPKAPIDDVLGVRPGMTYEEAANVVLCSADLMVVQPDSRGFQIKTYGQTLRQGFDGRFAQAKVEKTSKQIMQEMQDSAIARSGNRVAEPDVKPGQSKWYVGTMGLPGQERVINAAREEWFQEGRNPTMDSRCSRSTVHPLGIRHLDRINDISRGRTIRSAGRSPKPHRCSTAARESPIRTAAPTFPPTAAWSCRPSYFHWRTTTIWAATSRWESWIRPAAMTH